MMSINLQFTDRNIDGFKFGQMTMTGYKYIVILDKDFPEYGWKKGDMIAVSMDDHPCFRIETLFDAKTTSDDSGKLQTLKHASRFTLDWKSYKESEAADQ